MSPPVAVVAFVATASLLVAAPVTSSSGTVVVPAPLPPWGVAVVFGGGRGGCCCCPRHSRLCSPRHQGDARRHRRQDGGRRQPSPTTTRHVLLHSDGRRGESRIRSQGGIIVAGKETWRLGVHQVDDTGCLPCVGEGDGPIHRVVRGEDPTVRTTGLDVPRQGSPPTAKTATTTATRRCRSFGTATPPPPSRSSPSLSGDHRRFIVAACHRHGFQQLRIEKRESRRGEQLHPDIQRRLIDGGRRRGGVWIIGERVCGSRMERTVSAEQHAEGCRRR